MNMTPVSPPSACLFLRFLYRTIPGRAILKLATRPGLSKACGAFLSSPLSKFLIKPFVRKCSIDLNDYQAQDYRCFNDCFTRQIRPELRPVALEPETLIAPCDGFLSVYPITKDTVIPAKMSRYTIAGLLGSQDEAQRFQDGLCLVFRLGVDNYHRYCFADDAAVGHTRIIPGRLYTVRPVALERIPVFTENTRAVTMLETKNFGTVAQIEVGALLVGKIENHPHDGTARRGQEKGLFLYGGSTVILLLEKGRAALPQDYIDAAAQGLEIPVRYGQPIGQKASSTAEN
jgi:phosphatidylserine decarboxylase